MIKKVFGNNTSIQFFKFGIVGLSNSIISYLTYSFMIYCGLHYLIANFVSFIVGTFNSFIWNNKYVFKKQPGEKRNLFFVFAKMLICYAFTGIVLNSILSVIWIEFFKISKYLAPFCNIIITVPINFLLNKYWAIQTKV